MQSKFPKHSHELFEKAQMTTPGGVHSPVRAFGGVKDATPRFIASAHGAYITDEDGNTYIDYVCAYGPLILGHQPPPVVSAIQTQAQRGIAYGAPSQQAMALVRAIQERMPSLEQVRLLNSGTEACMSAIRLARAYTKKNKILKFSGCYHGHADSFLVAAGSGALKQSASSAGVPASVIDDTLIAPYNDLQSCEMLFTQYPNDIAAIIVEPIAANMNVVLPQAGYLQGLRDLADQHGALLIFDEVITGFRVHPGGAQSLYNITPDLTTLGKIIGGGLPVGALGGKRDIMQHLAPVGDVYQAGTMSANPMVVAAGCAALEALRDEVYETLEGHASYLVEALSQLAKQYHLPLHAYHCGSLIGLHFNALEHIRNLDDVKQGCESTFQAFFSHMLDHGHYFAPSPFEATFLSAAHTRADINQLIHAFDQFLAKRHEKN